MDGAPDGGRVERMARIPLIDPDDPSADPEVRSTLLELRQRFGADTNYYLALGNNAAALRGILALGEASYFGQHLDLTLHRAGLSDRLRHQRVSLLSADAHRLRSERRTLGRQDQSPSGRHPPRRRVHTVGSGDRRYARTSTRMEPIDDELYGQLKEHLSDPCRGRAVSHRRYRQPRQSLPRHLSHRRRRVDRRRHRRNLPAPTPAATARRLKPIGRHQPESIG